MKDMEKWILKAKRIFLRKDSLLICVLMGILLLVIVWPVEKVDEMDNTNKEYGLWDSKSVNIDNNTTSMGAKDEGESQVDTVRHLEERLEEILSVMEGVGQVKVMVTLAASAEQIIEKDSPTTRSNTLEEDSSGGNRNIQEIDARESTVYLKDGNGGQVPYVIKELSPQVEGVSVVCQGGGDPTTQKNISEVIQALFGIDVHKIKVVKMK